MCAWSLKIRPIKSSESLNLLKGIFAYMLFTGKVCQTNLIWCRNRFVCPLESGDLKKKRFFPNSRTRQSYMLLTL